MPYHKYYIQNLNDNMLSLKLSEESEVLNHLITDLEYMESFTPSKEVSIADVKDMIKVQSKLVKTIEEELKKRKAA